MPAWPRHLGQAAILLAASGALAIAVLFGVALTSGKSIAAGERAALVAGGVDLLLGVAAVLLFARLGRGRALAWRVAATAVFAVLELLLLGGLFVATLVVLNR